MKDPLKYFIQEGFGHIYAVKNSEDGYDITMRWAMRYKDYIPQIVGQTIVLQNMAYNTTHLDFVKNYATIVDSEEEAKRLIAEKSAEWETIATENENIGT